MALLVSNPDAFPSLAKCFAHRTARSVWSASSGCDSIHRTNHPPTYEYIFLFKSSQHFGLNSLPSEKWHLCWVEIERIRQLESVYRVTNGHICRYICKCQLNNSPNLGAVHTEWKSIVTYIQRRHDRSLVFRFHRIGLRLRPIGIMSTVHLI